MIMNTVLAIIFFMGVIYLYRDTMTKCKFIEEKNEALRKVNEAIKQVESKINC